MKRHREISKPIVNEELPELPQELWHLIVTSLEIRKFPSDSILNVEKLTLWINLSRVNKNLQTIFERVKENDVLLKEIYPVYPLRTGKTSFTFSFFAKYIQQDIYGSYHNSNMFQWLRIASSSERFQKISGMNEIITQIGSFKEFIGSNLKRFNVHKNTHGGEILRLVQKIDKRWSKKDPLLRCILLYKTLLLLEKNHSKAPPTIKEPGENTEYGRLFLYNKAWRKEGELNGKRGRIYTDKGVKLYLGAFKPLMAVSTMSQEDKVYQFLFPHYNGDKLRHHNILREANDRLAKLNERMSEIKKHVRRTCVEKNE